MPSSFQLHTRERDSEPQHSSRNVHLSSSQLYPNRAYQQRLAGGHPPTHQYRPTQQQHAPRAKGWLPLLFIILSLVGWLVAVPWFLTQSSSQIRTLLNLTNFTLNDRSLQALAAAREPRLKQTEDGVTNVMIVGIDTREKDKNGLRNTDTIILASFNSKHKTVSMVSFPRDILVNYPGTPNYGKINSVYQVGDKRKAGNGLEYLKQTIEGISNQTIHYYVMINLKGFEQIIDAVGGVSVTVDNPFTDYSYPTDAYGYQVVTFKKGTQKMNGEKALQFARSRHGTNGEASDYARARRQQKVIEALSNKVKSTETLQNPVKIYEIFKALAANIVTSPLTPEDIQAGMNLIPTYKDISTYNVVLDPLAGNSTLMQEGGAGYQFGFHIIPQEGLNKWSRVQKYLRTVFTDPALVKADPVLYVYYAGDPNFQANFTKFRNTYFYLPIYYGGSAGITVTGKQLHNTHATRNQDVLKHLAETLKYDYKKSTEGTNVPRPANVDAVILLGK